VEVIHEEGQRVPVLLWSRCPPPAAVKQLQRLAAQPWVVDQVAGMPDLHLAEGVAVGTVFATEHHAIPAALGGDLGCGVAALHFRCHAPSLARRQLGAALAALDRVIPTGDALQGRPGVPVPEELAASPLSTGALGRARDRLAPLHLGTLGGGNHFLELDTDPEGSLWLLIHTGSRGLGAAIREHHQAAAEAAGGGALAALDTRTEAGQAYLADVAWALRFARANRDRIAARASEILADTLGAEPEPESRVDVHHNFLSREEHGGRPVLVHRKGAVAAPEGASVLIPGSMGTATYVAEGRGDPRSFCSCSHGAGRVMSRSEARARVTPGLLEAQLRRVVFDRRKLRTLIEEAPAVYRDIREVMEDQRELVTARLRLSPLGVLKG
jgi:tRNA-splicing ligase RtcB